MSMSWKEAIGPVFAPNTVAEVLDTDEKSVFDLTSEHKLFAIDTSNGMPVYPIWQFDYENHAVLDGVDFIYTLIATASGHNSYIFATWMNMPNRLLDCLTPWNEFRLHGLSDRLVEAARCMGKGLS